MSWKTKDIGLASYSNKLSTDWTHSRPVFWIRFRMDPGFSFFRSSSNGMNIFKKIFFLVITLVDRRKYLIVLIC